jgi:hypothetical protein
MDKPHTLPAGSPGYETRDADTTGVLKFLVVLGIVLVLTAVVCYALFRYYSAHAQNQAASESPFAETRQVPSGPQLQVYPREDWLKFRAEQQKSLETLDWANRSAGIARVPIEDAMDLLVKKGVPVQGEAPAPPVPTSAGKPAAEGKKP